MDTLLTVIMSYNPTTERRSGPQKIKPEWIYRGPNGHITKHLLDVLPRLSKTLWQCLRATISFQKRNYLFHH